MAAPVSRIYSIKFSRLSSLISSKHHFPHIFYGVNCRLFTSTSAFNSDSENVVAERPDKAKKISSAMRAYLERAKTHDTFMAEQIADFEIGKRHLANIMGADPDNFTQEEIDQAIEYLLPSGLFDKKARPMLKHPEDIFPKKKAAQFGIDGRPFHPFFYTGMPNYYMIMHEASIKLDELKGYEDQMRRKGFFSTDEQASRVMAASSEWISNDELNAQTLEKVNEHNYRRFIIILERIMNHPYCLREKEFLDQFRKPIVVVGLTEEIQPLKEADNGRMYAEGEGRRKRATASVRLWGDGSGKVSINGHSFVDYFPQLMDREQIAFPIQFTDKLTSIDIEASVEGGGSSGQAGAIRLAVSRALMSFVDKEMVERMRMAGLLTWDPRFKERNKPGQWKARKKFTWKKR